MMIKCCVYAWCFFICNTCIVNAQNLWPRIITATSGEKLTIYEPQPETFAGNKLTGRAAISVRNTATEEPFFGAIFFTAILNTDKVSRMAEVSLLTITNAKFSDMADKSQLDKLTALIQKEAPKWNLTFSIDELVASIKKENVSTGAIDFKNDPPKIEYAATPTTLVVLDGEPQIQNDKDLGADKVVNSPYLIFKEGSQWNLYVGGTWYKSTSITNGWKPNTNLSAKLSSVNEQIKKQEAENNDGKAVTEKPKATAIIVATEPTELLQTEGEPDYKIVEGTSLIYVSNSTSEIFKDINTQQTYVVIAGRWYNAGSIRGPWTFVQADKLPADFARIPEGSDKDGVLANVAGTDEASEALIDAEIPQTAKVDRKTATVKVTYDGEPQFNRIDGTSLQLAENANLTVMIDPAGKYFALDNGVWFISDNANGPWAVANDRPRDVENIPASSPAYNTKYVYVYDQTPDCVYTGYTSGYMGGYIYGRTIVYGTGYRYRPWFRKVYYPRPVTWGYGFNYNPWNGWSMNWGLNFGYLFVGFHYGGRPAWGGGWFGPPRYRPPYRRPHLSGGYYGQNSRPGPGFAAGNRQPVANRPGAIGRPGSGWTRNTNLYNNHRGVVSRDIDRSKIISRPVITPGRPADNNRLPAGNGNNTARPGGNVGRPGNNAGDGNRLPGNNNGIPDRTREAPVSPINRDNNVLSDKDGKIYKRDPSNNNWQTRDNKSKDWKPVTGDNANKLPDLNKQQQFRDRAESRQNNFGRDVPFISRPPVARPSPAARPAPTARPAQGARPVFNRPAAPPPNRTAPSNPGAANPERKRN
jgi:hypothetical protein